MANFKSIFTLEVDSSALESLQGAMRQFQQDMKAASKNGVSADEKRAVALTGLSKIIAALLDQEKKLGHAAEGYAVSMEKALDASSKLEEQEKRRAERVKDQAKADAAGGGKGGKGGGSALDDIMRSGWGGVRGFGSILGATLKTAFLGLGIGAGGLWGLNSLAASKASDIGGSQRAGMSVAGWQAFGNAFGRVSDNPQALATRINGAFFDPKSWAALSQMGITGTPDELANMGTHGDESNARVLAAMAKYAKSNPNMNAAQFDASGLGALFGSLGEYRQLGQSNATGAAADYTRQMGSANITNDTAERARDFMLEMDKIATRFGNTLITELAPALPAIDKTADALSHLIADVIKEAVNDGWVDKLAKGLGEFADWLNGGGGKQIVDFFDGLTHLTLSPGASALIGAVGGARVGGLPGAVVGAAAGLGVQQLTSADSSTVQGADKLVHNRGIEEMTGSIGTAAMRFFNHMRGGVPEQILQALQMQENAAGDPDLDNAAEERDNTPLAERHHGVFQTSFANWQKYMGGDITSWRNSTKAQQYEEARRRLSDQMKQDPRFNTFDAVAALNLEGPTGLKHLMDKAASEGKHWQDELGDVGKQHLANVRANAGLYRNQYADMTVRIDVNNAPGVDSSVQGLQSATPYGGNILIGQ